MSGKCVWIRLISAFLMIGCGHKPTIENPSDTAQNLEAPQLICPNYYRIKHPRDVVDKDELDSPDGVICSDGQAYCYAHGQKPILVPTDWQNWECIDVTEDNFWADADLVENEYPFCGRDGHKLRLKANRNMGRQRAWVCKYESCMCGGKPCPEGGRCNDGICVINDFNSSVANKDTSEPSNDAHNNGAYDESENSSGICDYIETSHDTYYPEYKGDPANDKSSYIDHVLTYPCGDTWLTSYSNRYCLAHPAGNMVMHEICPSSPNSKAVGSIEDVHIDDENQMISIELDDDALDTMRHKGLKFAMPDRDTCACGNEWCASDTACWKDHCVDIATLQGLPSNDYRWNYGRPICAASSCACGPDTCHTGEWCIEGKCFDTPDVIKLDNKYIKYGLYVNTITEKYYYDENKLEPLPRNKFTAFDDIIWLDIVVNKFSAQCEETSAPDNIDDYICVIDKVDNACGEGATDTYAFRGYHCMKDDGCVCGNTKCSKFAQCHDGQCRYDEIYLAMACAADYNLWGFHEGDINVDNQGWCLCGISHTPPNMLGFTCDPDAGMECGLNDGCECGDVICKKYHYCIEPGKCVENLWDMQEEQ